MLGFVRVVVVVAVLAPAIARAAPRSYSVDVAPVGDWRAEALGVALAHDLADDRLVAASGAPASTGSAATGAAPDIVVHVTIDGRALRYEARATWPGAPPPVAGTIALGRADGAALGPDRAVIAGQLRDQLHRLARATRDDRADVAVAAPSRGAIAGGLAIVVVLLAIPFALGRKRPPLRAIVAVAGVAGAAFAMTFVNAPWLLAGGLAWGAFAAVTIPIVFPPVVGFGRIEQSQLARVLATWLASVGRRALAVALGYTPVAVVAWLLGRALGLDPTLVPALAIPLALLAARLWIRCAAVVAAAALDKRFADPGADAKAWHAATREYVIGYLRRASLPVDHELLAHVRFVPGKTDGVIVYGGGLTDSRIVIPCKMLELALAPAGRPHDYAAPRVSTLHWTEWNAGLVMATEPDAVIATAEQRQPRTMTEEGEHERQMLGEPPTLAGTIEPSDLDARRTYRPHEDRIWLDWDSGEEYDGTDPGDRDFLFGAIVHSLGEIQRHADRAATFLLLARRSPRAIALADDHAMVAGARHHLVQYLAWRLWQREDLLTARAFAPELEAATKKSLATLVETKTGDARMRRRLARLGDPERAPAWRRYAFAGALAACVALAAIAVAGAVRYHATYVEEITHG